MKPALKVRSFAAFSAVVLLGGLVGAAGAAAAPGGPGAERVKVIGVFKDSVDHPGAAARDLQRRHGGQVDAVYRHAIEGFAGEFPRAALAGLASDERVDYVELDQVVTTAAQDTPTGIRRIFAPGNAEIDIDAADDFRVDVDVAVLDTGIDLDHPDLNVFASTDCFHSTSSGPPWGRTYSCGSGGDDDHGHGTHVAGTAAALDNGIGVVGVAPGARLWAVKVLDSTGSGYMSNIVAGIDYVTANAAAIEVANMSLGCECTSAAMDTAIANSVSAGVVYAVAAGNSDKDSATFSPANHPDVITVSALADFDGAPGGTGAPTCRTDQDDTLADFSNWGQLVEIAAPGVCISSTYPGGGYATYSGTSMASPHVAGAAALLASMSKPASKADVQNLSTTLQSEGNLNWTDDSGDGVKEPLLDVGDAAVFNPVLVAGTGGGGGGGDDITAPTVSITTPQSGATVSGTTGVTFSASDDVSVAKVELWVDGVLYGADTDGSNGWQVAWDTTTVADGSHQLVARAYDAANNTGTSAGVGVTVSNTTTGFSLSATGYKVKGVQHADLSWSGTTSTTVDVYRDNVLVATPANTGGYTDNIGGRGGGSYVYRVCEAGTTTCSNEATVVFN